jgi:hypothetical protein
MALTLRMDMRCRVLDWLPLLSPIVSVMAASAWLLSHRELETRTNGEVKAEILYRGDIPYLLFTMFTIVILISAAIGAWRKRLRVFVVLLSTMLAVGIVTMWIRSEQGSETIVASSYEICSDGAIWHARGATSSAGGIQIYHSGFPVTRDDAERWKTRPALSWTLHYASRNSWWVKAKYPLQVRTVPAPPGESGFVWGAAKFQLFRRSWVTCSFVSIATDPMFAGGGRISDTPRTVVWSGCTVPYWFLALITVLSPGCCLFRLAKRTRRGRLGLCLHCGYDLRASRNRCPECGSTIQHEP